MNIRPFLIGLLFTLQAYGQDAPASEFRLHSMMQSKMVIQRDKPMVIRGNGKAGELVAVAFAGKSAKAEVAKDDSWMVTLPAMPANGVGQKLVATSGSKRIELEDVLIGDVWVIAGQSNMQHPLSGVEGGQLEIASAHYPKIRLLTVPPLIDDKRKYDFVRRLEGEKEDGDWKHCTPKTVPPFSAIGYAFGRRLHMASQVPMGLIDVSRWGTTVESWTPREVLEAMKQPYVDAQLKDWEEKIENFDPEKDLQARIARYKKHRPDGKNPPTEFDPGPQANQNYPGNCFNSFIAPIAGFPVKGAIYHQGFNNARHDAAEFYQPVFAAMIESWRAAFEDLQLPFGIISLCTDSQPQTLENYCESMLNFGIQVREAQYKTFLDFHQGGDANVGFASSYNLRHAWYHPQNKLPAGERIARWALATQYGVTHHMHWKPPIVTKMEVVNGTIRLHFDEMVEPEERGAVIEGFAVSGEDKKYQPARAEPLVTGKDGRGRPQYNRKVLVLSSPHVAEPVHYRYAWGRNPMGNLRASGNAKRHIAVGTQRSDDWPWWEVPGVVLPEHHRDQRQHIENVRKALRKIDAERRIADARLILEAAEASN